MTNTPQGAATAVPFFTGDPQKITLAGSLAARFLARPVAMAAGHYSACLPTIFKAQSGADLEAEAPNTAPAAATFFGQRDGAKNYHVGDDGIAVVPVHGVLVDRGAWLGMRFGMTSYEGLAEQFRLLAEDDDIKHVLLDIDSGGGMVAGLWDVMPSLARLKKKKTVTAFAHNFAASAAFAIAAAADRVVLTRAGSVGSVGVISQHVSIDKMMEKIGTATLVHAGAKKADGHGYAPLPAEVRDDWQGEVDAAHDQFLAHVAKHRDMTLRAVRKTEAAMFTGKKAVEMGFADEVRNFDELILKIKGELKMAAKTPAGDQPKTEAPSTQAAPSASAVQTDGEIRADERKKTMARIAAILDADEAQGRTKLARELAFSTDLDADAAKRILSAAATEAVAAPAAETQQHAAQQASGAGFQNALAAQMSNPANSANIAPDQAVSAPNGSPGAAQIAVSLADSIRAGLPQKGDAK